MEEYSLISLKKRNQNENEEFIKNHTVLLRPRKNFALKFFLAIPASIVKVFALQNFLYQKLEIPLGRTPTLSFALYSAYIFIVERPVVSIEDLVITRTKFSDLKVSTLYKKALLKNVSKKMGVPLEEAQGKFDSHIEKVRFNDRKLKILEQLKIANPTSYADITEYSLDYDIYVNDALITINNIEELLPNDGYEILLSGTKTDLETEAKEGVKIQEETKSAIIRSQLSEKRGMLEAHLKQKNPNGVLCKKPKGK
jgi:hypothetical protein